MTDVFLGGSCNPTQWRKEIAIPMLEEHNVSFYNPQVSLKLSRFLLFQSKLF